MVIGTSLDAFLTTLAEFPTPLWATEPGGQIVLWNASLTRLLGRKAPVGDMAGAHLRMRDRFTPRTDGNPLLAEVFESGREVSWADAGLALEGSDDLIPVDAWGVPLTNPDGETVAALGVVQDTRREALHRKAVDGFQRTVGHDIRNAVSVLEGYLPLLMASEGRSESSRPIIETLGRASQLLNGITTLMLSNARLTHGFSPLDPERLLLSELVLEAVRTIGPAAYNKDVRITTEVGNEVLVRGSKELLTVAMTNVVYAAVKFARNRTEVEVRAARHGNIVLCTLRFACKPIPHVEVERLFSSLSEPEDPRLGTGLALYMARRILRHHRCEVTLEADTDAISIFRLTLPSVAQ